MRPNRGNALWATRLVLPSNLMKGDRTMALQVDSQFEKDVDRFNSLTESQLKARVPFMTRVERLENWIQLAKERALFKVARLARLRLSSVAG